MVVVELQYSDRASLSTMEEEDVLEREREAPKAWLRGPPSPTIYRAKGEGGGRSLWPFLQGRVRPGRSPSSPRHLGGAFPL